MPHAKPSRRWIAVVDHAQPGCSDIANVEAISWYLARQAAAVALHTDPDEIAVRLDGRVA